MLALRLLRPQATGAIEDAVAFLADRESVDGGWNLHGNRFVYDVALPPFGQTTAVALIGLHGMRTPGPSAGLVSRGVGALRRLWPVERGHLTLATSMAAFRLLELADTEEVEDVLERSMDRPVPDVIALGWIALASGPGLLELAGDVVKPIDRRTFLKRAGIVVAGSAAVGVATGIGVQSIVRRLDRPWDEAAFAPPGRPRVLVARVASYESDLETIVEDGLRDVGASLGGRSVLLKPNLVEYDPDTVINTDPRLVAATVLAVRRLGASSVVVAEGPGHRRDTPYVISASGLGERLSDVDARFVDLNLAPVTRVPLHSRFTELGELWLPRPVVDADVVISMPKMKTHHWAGATLSMKNCFGCVPGRIYGWPKNVLHWAGLQEAVIDVASAVRPDLQIVDGIVGMEGNGPIDGTPVGAGVLLFGTDPVATDSTAARVMGLDPSGIWHVNEAGRFLGQADPELIAQVGEDPEGSMTSFDVLPVFEDLKMGSASGANGAGPDGFG